MKKYLIAIIVLLIASIILWSGIFVTAIISKSDNSASQSTEIISAENYSDTSNTAQITENSKITIDDAKKIALNAAGVNDATFIKAEKDYEHGKSIYEIEFRNGTKKWEYDIDASTGSIINYDIDDNSIIAGNIPSANNTSITAEQAEEIVLKDAGTNRNTVKYLKSKKDLDDGRAIFDIEFIFNNREYEYEIDASTGTIISKDMD